MTNLLLVGNSASGTISAFTLTDGTLQHLTDSPVGKGCSTFAIDPERNLVHTTVKSPEPAIVTLRLDRSSGALTELGRIPVSDPMAYLSLAHEGTVLLGASYHGGWGTAWPLADGLPGPAPSRIQHKNLHCVIPDREGQHAYFASLGDDLVATCALAEQATLTPLGAIRVEKDMGPRHLVLNPDQTRLYLLTEFTAEVLVFERSADGQLTRVQTTSTVNPEKGLSPSRYGADPKAEHLVWAADLHLARDGRYLVTSERCESTLTVLELDRAGLVKRVVGWTDCEQQPRGFAVAPDGEHLVVAGEASGHLGLMHLEESGTLTTLDRVSVGEGPNWLLFL